MMKNKMLFLCSILTLGFTLHAGLIQFSVLLDGAQANAGAGVDTPGHGSGWILLDTDTDTLDWSITYSDLIGDVTNAHFHGPALVNQNAGVQITIFPDFDAEDIPISVEQQQQLLDGLWYVNIHTTEYAGGEIRGQVTQVPEPATLALVGLGGVTILRKRLKT